MNKVIRNKLKELEKKFSGHKGLKYYLKDEANKSSRIWRQLRTDIMRKQPEEMQDYLKQSNTKLSEIEYTQQPKKRNKKTTQKRKQKIT